jgi:hypothetical protein
MQHDWPADDLATCWTLSADERTLLTNKTGATRLSFALLLKAFQLAGRFPDRRDNIAESSVAHLAAQVGVAPETYPVLPWSERTQHHHRAQIRDYCGFRVFRADDERDFVAWLSTCVTSLDPEADPLVREEIEKLRQLRALGLPEHLLRAVPAKLVTHYRQRAASEKPRELRRHPPATRYMLLAALCWQRAREITDTLVDLLLHIAHRIGARAEEKVEEELRTYVEKIVGKPALLYKLGSIRGAGGGRLVASKGAVAL